MLTKRLSQYFLRGLITILPLGLTVYLLYLFVSFLESMAMFVIRPIVGDFYLPGLGIALAVLAILALGFLISQSFTSRVVSWVELPFTNLPVIKSIYSSLKNFADYFAPHNKQDSQQVVRLSAPGSELSIVGLVTRQNMNDLPEGLASEDHIAVYLPMGYMIGGYTVFVPRSWVQPIDMSVEEAMRSALIAWMAASRTSAPGSYFATDQADRAARRQAQATNDMPMPPAPPPRRPF
ncbi:MAG: DUF502 domain-containing protein [Hydrogenophaga sp.]|jgi:uncharacterized membrane protein|nr:DUF502 domain-containing protein [Hydrogenophaga sp.]